MVGIKSALKLVSVMILTAVVVFICTIFINYHYDLSDIKDLFPSPEMQDVFEGVMVSTTNVIILATVGVFGTIALLILMFTIRQFINDNSAELGILKALGYSEGNIALSFSKFGLSVFIGSSFGYLSAYLASSTFYEMLISDYVLPTAIVFSFRFHVFFIMMVAPALLFTFISILYAYLRLKKPPLDLIKGYEEVKVNKLTQNLQSQDSDLPFLEELKRTMLTNHLMLMLFIGFAAFAFASQLQMAFTVRQLVDHTLMTATFIISGLIAGSVTLLLALTFIMGKNKKYVALLKAYGYTKRECSRSLFGGYRMVTYIGFIIGTVFQYVFIAFVIARFFDNTEMSFNFFGFIIALFIFISAYELILLFYKRRISQIPLREIMLPNS